jgi:hypothetical protein
LDLSTDAAKAIDTHFIIIAATQLAVSSNELVRIVFSHPLSSIPVPTVFSVQKRLPSQGSWPEGPEGYGSEDLKIRQGPKTA